MRINKGRDSHQKGAWRENTGKMLEFLRARPNEQFRVCDLSEKVGLSNPTVRKHLCSLESNGDVISDGGRPAKYRLRPLYPMHKPFVEKVQETLAYASPDTPPDKLTLELSKKEHYQTQVTVVRNGKEYSRRYKLIVNSGLSIAAAAKCKR